MSLAWIQDTSPSHQREREVALLEHEGDEKKEDIQPGSITSEMPNSSFKLASLVAPLNLSVLKPAWLRPKPRREIHSTSWLDGLRGVAALIVFFHHSSQVWLPDIRPGWGSNPSAYHIMQLPILRIVFSGGAMVSIFFVISGYVLSKKHLKLAREARYTELFDSLSSSTFRRGPRLYIPCLVSTFLTAAMAMIGLFVDEGVSRHYPHFPTWREQLGWWMHDSLWFINPFGSTTGFEQNLWTIPIEFKGSLLIFLCALGLSKCRNVVRTGTLCWFTAYWLWYGHWDSVLFLSGMTLADIHFYFDPPTELGSARIGARSRSTVSTQVVLLVIAIYLLSMPEGDEAVEFSPGFRILSTTLTPESWHSHWGAGRWWPCISAVMLVATIDHAGPTSIFQRLFTCRFAQYLGDISFSLYLCHGIAIYTFGIRVVRFFTSIFGEETRLQYGLAMVLGAGIVMPVLFWVSDVFTSIVDRGAVELAARMMKL